MGYRLETCAVCGREFATEADANGQTPPWCSDCATLPVKYCTDEVDLIGFNWVRVSTQVDGCRVEMRMGSSGEWLDVTPASTTWDPWTGQMQIGGFVRAPSGERRAEYSDLAADKLRVVSPNAEIVGVLVKLDGGGIPLESRLVERFDRLKPKLVT